MASTRREEQPADRSLDFAHFVRLVLDALDALQLKYLVGGAVAVWAWGEVRTTRDLDLVIELPVEAITDLSRELAQRDMLVPADIILDILLNSRSDLAITSCRLPWNGSISGEPIRRSKPAFGARLECLTPSTGAPLWRPASSPPSG